MSLIGPLLRDLERAASSDEERRVAMLEQIADLYLGNSSDLPADAIDLFDEVLVRLATEIARRARADLSQRLAAAERAPPRLVRQLVHDVIEVARPLLERGTMLSEDDLLSVAMTRGDEHRQIVAGRPHISERITTALVERGGPPVLRRVVANATANISGDGFDKLVSRAGGDEVLQRLLAERKELPIIQVHRLIDIAGAAAKTRLQTILANVDPKAVEAAVDGQIGQAHLLAGSATTRRSYDAAMTAVAPLAKTRSLNETHLRRFAEERKFEEMVCALSGMTRVSLKTIETVFDGADTDRFLVLCKALNLDGNTVRVMARLGFIDHPTIKSSEQMLHSYDKLSHKTAQRIVQFLADREKSAAEPR